MLNQRETELANQRYAILSQKIQIDKALETIEIQLAEVQRLKAMQEQQIIEQPQEPKE